MVRGRKRRLRNFGQRAEAFYDELAAGTANAREVERDWKRITVGTGNHKRLTLKRHPLHAAFANQTFTELVLFLRDKKITPKHYALAGVRSTDSGVQEYFDRPSVLELMDFFELKKVQKAYGGKARTSTMSKEEAMRCKQFLNQPKNKGITLDKLQKASEELSEHHRKVGLAKTIPSNIIVLGTVPGKEGIKVRLAIVDV